MENLENRSKTPESRRVLVVLHIYYEEYISYYLDKLKNINGCEWDLVITGHRLGETVRCAIMDFKTDAIFYETANVGYDVWPFIYAIKRTDLDKYCFVIKLHTKNQDNVVNRLNGISYTGAEWRSELVNALLGSEKQFSKVRNIFFRTKHVGLVYAMCLDIIRGENLIEDSRVLSDEMERLGFEPKSNHFCGGTMFAVRAKALGWMKSDSISEDLFQHSDGSHKTATMAHVYERILSMAVTSEGYSTYLIRTGWCKYIFIKFKRCVQPSLEWLFSIDYRGEEHCKVLKIFGFKFKLN